MLPAGAPLWRAGLRRSNCLRRLLALAALLASAAPAAAFAQGLKVSPVFAFFKVPPGESAPVTYILQNQSAVPFHVTVSLTDAWHTEDGARIFPEPGGSPQGLGKWLVLPAKTRLVVQPNGETRFQGIVNVPLKTQPGTYLGGYVLTLGSTKVPLPGEAAPDKLEVGARMITKIVMLVHVDVREQGSPAPTPDVEIVGQTVEPPHGGQPLVVRLHLVNHGKFEIKPAGTLAIIDDAGKVVGKADFPAVSIWPKQQLWLDARYVEHLASGKYTGFAAFALEDPTGLGESYSAPPLQRKVEFQVGALTLKPPPRPVPMPKKPEASSKTHGT